MSSQVVRSFKTMKEKIRYLLHKYPSARDSDNMLLLLYLKHFTEVKIDFIPKNLVDKKIPHPDTISRAKRFIQNTEKDPLAQSSQKVKEMKRKAEEEMREYFRKNSKEAII